MANNPGKINTNDAVGEIKNRLDIVDVVSEHVALKKSGKNFWGCCPFHKEKTPSFSVSPDKGIFKCFGCGEGGDSISFLMKINNNTFYEVISEEAQKFGIQLNNKSFSPEKAELKTRIHEVNLKAVNYFKKLLLDSPDAEKARKYLSGRGITKEVIEKFGLGYASGKFDSLINYFKSENVQIDLLDKAGLVSEKSSGNGYIDRFRSRIMIPVRDESGNYIAFGARALADDQNPKYLNSPDTLVFNKSRTLFALYEAKQSIKEQDGVIIMEGFFDVISAHIQGLTNVVASQGTSLTEQHIKMLAKYSESRRIYLAFDSDAAGIKATDRGAEIIKSVFSGLGDIKQFDENFAEISSENNRSVCEIRVISNTSGKDPDEFLRTEGIEAYKKVIEEAPLLIDYQINRIMKLNDNIETPQDKAKVVNALIPIFSDVKNSVIRNEYIKLVSEKLKINEESLNIEVKKSLQKITTRKKSPKVEPGQGQEAQNVSVQKNLLSLYFLNNEKLSILCINECLKEVDFTDANIKLIKNEIAGLTANKTINSAELSKELFVNLAENEEAKRILTDVICSAEDKKEMNAGLLERYIKDHTVFLKRFVLLQQQNNLRKQYIESNNDDVSSLEHQQSVKKLILQGKID